MTQEKGERILFRILLIQVSSFVGMMFGAASSIKSSWRQYTAVFIGTLGVASAGVCFAWMEPLMLRMKDEFNISPSDSSWLLSSVEYGELAFCIPVGILADRYGRKFLLLSVGPLSLVSLGMTLYSQSLYFLYVVRFVQGAVIALAFGILPLYIAEIAEAKLRGLLAGQFQTMWSLGILFTYLTGPVLPFTNYIIVCGILPLIFTILFFFMPESPYYHFMSKNDKMARKSLEWLRGKKEVDEELEAIHTSVRKDMECKTSWSAVFATSRDRKIFYTVQLLCFIKYMIGTTVMTTNVADTFARGSNQNAPMDEHTAAIVFGVLLIASAFFGAFLSDSIGRRPLLISTCILIGISNLITGIYFYLIEYTDIDLGNNTWVVYLTIGLSAVFSNIGPSSLLQTIQGELFPSNTRALGNALTTVTASIATFLDLKQYQTVQDLFGHYMNFLIFAFFSLGGALMIACILKETAGKRIGESNTDKSESNGIHTLDHGYTS